MKNLIIIGSGPAGYTAGIYAARAGLNPLLIASSIEAGGELMKTTEVENFPGFPEGIMGPDLMENMRKQAEKFGCTVIYDDVTSLELTETSKKVTLGDGVTHEAHAVIFATGSAYRKLGVPGEDRLSGYGVSWCATCDGFFFREKTIAVIGGGDSALEEATFLTRFAEKVYVIHRRDSFRASKIMQDRALSNEKIECIWNTEVVSIEGKENVEQLKLHNTKENTFSSLDVSGVFIAIGTDPRVHLVHNQLALTADGTIQLDSPSSKTSIPGVFAAGDVTDSFYRQAITAAGSGTIAALDAQHYLADLQNASSNSHS